ncbi:MAG: prolipoprotein diacylglyceryl transferase, partial [Candidatus Brocadiia bacterium]
MHPYLLRIPLPGGGSFPVASYGFMILVGFLLCLWLLQRRGARMGLDPVALFDVAVAGLLGGIVGARIFYVVQHWELFASEPVRILFLHEGGLSIFGGLIGGALGLMAGIRKKRLPLVPALDVAAGLVP